MAYLGRQLTSGNYLKLDDISSQFNGSTKTFDLRSGGNLFYAGSAFSILVVLGGVIQEPESAYTIDQYQITFASAPGVSDDFFCIALGVALGIGVPGEGTVTGTKLSKPFNYNNNHLTLDTVNTRVGINSSTPGYTLDINGDINFNGIFYQNGSQFVASRWTAGAGTTIYRNSSVGIGTASPVTMLEVNKNGAVSFASRAALESSSHIVLRTDAALSAIVWPGTTTNSSKYISWDHYGGTQAFRVGAVSDTNVKTELLLLNQDGTAIFSRASGESMRLDSSGRLGLGTSAPGNKLAVIGTTGTLADASIRINSTAGTQSANSGLWLSGNQSTSHYNWLIASQYNVNGALEITPSTAVNGATFSTPTAVFTQTGRLGIGTASPQELLHVNTGASGGQVLRMSTNGADVGYLYQNTGAVILGAYSTRFLGFETNGAERARIDSSGRLCLGTSAVTGTNTRLEVSNDSAEIKVSSTSAFNSNFRGIRFGVSGDSVDYSGVRFQPNSGELRTEAGFATWGGFQTFYTNGLERLRIDISGRVGIGTASPARVLDVTPSSVNAVAARFGNVAGRGLEISTFLTQTVNDAGVSFNALGAGVGAIAFQTDSSERARIDSSGRLLVGTSSGTCKVEIKETSSTAGFRALGIIGSPINQGAPQKYTIVRQYAAVSLGTKLKIPFVSQGNLNGSTICKIYGHGARFNTRVGMPFEITFGVGHLNVLSDFSYWGGGGNFSSITTSGMTVEITFTTAYTSATDSGVYVCIEYMTNVSEYSIDVANIAMN